MYNQTPLTAFLPSDESQFDMPVREGWKAEEVRLVLANRCNNCQETLFRGVMAVAVSRIDPEAYARESGKKLEYAKRIITYCNRTCQRKAYFKLKNATRKAP